MWRIIFILALVMTLALPFAQTAIAAGGPAKDIKQFRKELADCDKQEHAVKSDKALGEKARKDRLNEIQQLRTNLLSEIKESEIRLKKIAAGLDTTKSVSNICPIHGGVMEIKVAPIVYGMLLQKIPPDVRQREFPFALKYWPGGCVSGEDSPKQAKIYICPECEKAEKEWLINHKSKTAVP